MKTKKKKIVSEIKSYLLLTNPITQLTLPDESYRATVATFIAHEKSSNFEPRFTRLLEKERFRSRFNAYANRIEEFTVLPIFRSGISVERMWAFYKCLYERSAKQLSDFSILRDAVEQHILLGEFKSAEILLETSLDIYGESIWYIRTKILILSYQDRNTEMREFCNNCKARATQPFVRHLVNCFQLISDADDAFLHLKTLVQTVIDEFREAEVAGLASLLEILFIPQPMLGKASYTECLFWIQALPIIDQYPIFIEVLQRSVLFPSIQGAPNRQQLAHLLDTLSELINDPLLHRIRATFYSKADQEPSEIGKILIGTYEEGNYNEVIRIFHSSLKQFKNPLAYVNLVAKSYAYTNHKSLSHSKNSIIDLIIRDLASIYKLTSFRSQAEEEILSSIIKLRGFSCNASLQLMLFKALPHRYEFEQRKEAALLATISSPEVTPLASVMAQTENNILGIQNSYVSKNNAPRYRILKREICQRIINDPQSDKVLENFQELAKSSPLEKDYFELYADYCLYTNRINDLINFSANALIADANNFVCFPMEKLMQHIETSRLASIEGVIVSYYYNKNISTKKDYVLHEAFEENVLQSGAKKPSQILESLQLVNEMQLVFFRDVCVLEVMDFLSCFYNTNELRAERVRILDLLLEKGLVDSDVRMREVEEIVEQAILDAGTNKLNGAKVYVDDSAIKRKNIEEVRSLLAVYRQSKDSNDDRLTFLGEELKRGEMQTAYLSGSKNATALKIYNLITLSFLYDEKHGLDKNLSTEIRHGFFSNLMRARLEERSLITEKNEDGEYKPNQFWQQANSFLKPSIWNEIDEHLQRFSSDFNALVFEAEEWMKIEGDPSQENRVFSYIVEIAEFQKVKGFIELHDDAERVVSYIIRLMWEKTEKHLAKIREKLNFEFRDRIGALFETLVQCITYTKRGAPMLELMNAIGHARSEIKEDITTAVGWFKRSENLGIDTQSLDLVVEMAISSFEKVKGSAFGIEKEINISARSALIPSRSIKPTVIAIINLLDNCYRHSGLGRETRVQISADASRDRAEIAIRNNLCDEKLVELTSQYMAQIDAKMRGPNSSKLMRSEGGSGVTKAFNEVISFSAHSDMQIKIQDGFFSARITYEL